MKKGKILVVDDEVNITQILEFSIGSEGFEVLTAQNGEEAIEKARREQPDLIILDIMMPEKDGFIACGDLKKNPVTASIPVIVLTSVESSSLIFPDAESAAGAPHADEYIDKPVDPNFLLKRVERLLKKSQG